MYIDMILRSKAIYNSVELEPFDGYVAVEGNRISEVGRGDIPSALIGENTDVRDCGDRLVMAGFHDSHTHLIMAGLFNTYVNLLSATSEEEAVRMVKESAETMEDKDGWILGFCWYHVFWENKRLPTKASLDAVFQDRPVCLINAEAHGAWVNTRAMEIAGITRETPDPFGGEIARDENGEPEGFLYESATGLVTKYAFDFTPEQEEEIIGNYLDSAKAYGITSVTDVQPYFHGEMGNLEVYADMEARGKLTARLHVATDLLGDLDRAERLREQYRSDKLRVDLLKQFLDGVCTTHTALVLEDYADAPGSQGISLNDTEAIRNAVPEAHRRGFSIKLHSCGDRSARLGLDYFENAIELYGRNDCRHAIEHCEIVAASDRGRFGELGVYPSVQPEHIALTQTFAETPYRVVLGEERAATTWPYRDLLESAGEMGIGSDCPVVDNNPFLEIYRGITRVHNDGEPAGGWNPTQKLTLAEVLRGYTYGGAYLCSREDELGSLEKGKFADIVVLDRNLFTATPEEIYSGRVDLTIMDGKIVYDRLGDR